MLTVVAAASVKVIGDTSVGRGPAWEPILLMLSGAVTSALGGFGAQWFRTFLDREDRRRTMSVRITYMLCNGIVLGKQCARRNAALPIPMGWMRDVIAVWSSYERVSDFWLLSKRYDISVQTHSFLEQMRIDAETVIDVQERARLDLREGRIDGAAAEKVYKKLNAAVASWEAKGASILKRLAGEGMVKEEVEKLSELLRAEIEEPRDDVGRRE